VSWRDLDLDEHDPRCLAASWLADDAGPSNVGLLIGSTGAATGTVRGRPDDRRGRGGSEYVTGSGGASGARSGVNASPLRKES
jgi:hypothetical protein